MPKPEIFHREFTLQSAIEAVERQVAPYRHNPKGTHPVDSYLVASVRNHPSESWDDNLGFERTLEAVKSGFPSFAKQVIEVADKMQAAVEIDTASAGLEYRVDGGSFVDIGRFLNGEPEHYIDFADAPKRRAITIVLEQSASCGVDASSLKRRGAAALSVAASLERRGFAVQLVARNSRELHRNGVNCKTYDDILVKPYGMPWDADAVAITGHPAFFRRFCFALDESLPPELARGLVTGYGMPITHVNEGELSFPALGWQAEDAYWVSDESALARTEQIIEKACEALAVPKE